jgi:flagellar hook assembly protein FlgD
VKKKIAIVAAATALLAVPASAFALTTSPAVPATFSLSGANGVPTCTVFPYTTTAKSDHLAIITVFSAGVKVKSIRRTDVPAGKHTMRWCGKNNTGGVVTPGAYTWNVKTRHFAGTVGYGPATAVRTVTVVA